MHINNVGFPPIILVMGQDLPIEKTKIFISGHSRYHKVLRINE